MTFGDPTAFLAKARERRKVMMRSTCRITRPAGERTWDPDSGTYTPPGYDVIYEGPCHLMSRVTNAISEPYQQLASAEVAAETTPIAIPWDAPRVDNGDTMEILTSDDQWMVDAGPRPIGWVRYADSRTHRIVFILLQDRPAVNDA